MRVPSFRIKLEFRVFIDRSSAGASAGGITALDHKIGGHPVKDCAGIVVVLAVLKEVFAGERGLVCEERELDGANRCVERRRRSGIGLAGVLGGHDGQVSYRFTARATSEVA